MVIFITLLIISFIILTILVIVFGIYIVQTKKSQKPPTQEQVLQQKAETRITKEQQQLSQELERIKIVEPQDDLEKRYLEERKALYQTKLEELPKQVEKYKIETNKSGFLYIISNNQTFSKDNAFKIGMTRRDDATKRIKELSNASVPFGFHTVSIIFSDNVVDLETKLHKELANYRWNTENKRKEFFLIDKEKLIEVVHKYDITAKFNFED